MLRCLLWCPFRASKETIVINWDILVRLQLDLKDRLQGYITERVLVTHTRTLKLMWINVFMPSSILFCLWFSTMKLNIIFPSNIYILTTWVVHWLFLIPCRSPFHNTRRSLALSETFCLTYWKFVALQNHPVQFVVVEHRLTQYVITIVLLSFKTRYHIYFLLIHIFDVIRLSYTETHTNQLVLLPY